MEQTLSVKPRRLNGKAAIIVLSSLAVLMRVVGYFAGLVQWFLSQLELAGDYVLSCLERGMDIDMSRLDKWINRDLDLIDIPDGVSTVLSTTANMLFTVMPFVLLIIYVAFLYKKSKATVIIPIAFGILTLRDIVSCITAIGSYVSLLQSDEYHFASTAQQHSMEIGVVVSCIVVVLLCIPSFVLDLLLVIGSLKGFVNKALIIVPAIIQIAFQLLGAMVIAAFQVFTVIMGASGFVHMDELYIINSISSFIVVGICSTALVLFFIAVIILAVKNYIPEIIPMKDEKLMALAVKKPKAAHEILRNRYESGKISEEYYNARIDEINRQTTLS